MKSNGDSDKQLADNTQDLVNFQDYQIATAEKSQKPVAAWRLWVPLLIQAGLILSVPAQAVYTHLTGKTAVLQTIPYDPYDPFRGYSVTLSYDISRPETLKQLPGWAELVRQNPRIGSFANKTNFYVILEQPKSFASSLPGAWKPVAVSSDRPTSLAANQVALKGLYTYGSIAYGLETYYIPEAQQKQINKDIAEAGQGRQKQPIVVEVKVDAQGHAVPISFWVSEHKYRY